MFYKVLQYLSNTKTCISQYSPKTYRCEYYDKNPRKLHVDYLTVKVRCLCTALLYRTLMEAEFAAHVARYQPAHNGGDSGGGPWLIMTFMLGKQMHFYWGFYSVGDLLSFKTLINEKIFQKVTRSVYAWIHLL